MITIHEIESPKGTYSCEIGVSVEDWKEILTNNQVTKPNYKKALLDYYYEPNHQATCKELALKYYGDPKQVTKYVSLITKYGMAIIKHLNRFRIQNSHDEKDSYWSVTMNPGVLLPNRYFQWTVRKELVQAIEELGWGNRFAWASFYEELADKLLEFKKNRKDLLDIVYSLDGKSIAYLKFGDEEKLTDIDPFTVIGIFNRGLSDENRFDIAKTFKEKFKLQAEAPSSFRGIPILDPRKSIFFSKDSAATDIQPLWDFFEACLSGDRQQLAKCMDIVRHQKGMKWNVTMVLYWIRPYQYIALDSINRSYLPKIGVEVFHEKQLDSTHYFGLLDQVRQKIQSNAIKEKSIPEISYNAWIGGDAPQEETNNEQKPMKYQAYIDLLKANKNLVLTGAPGTGKTHMAQAIAKEMESEYKFVQFHPSYDYTDFVEGLRPIQNEVGQIGFERRDGVFKEFCKQAIKNLTDSEKTVERLSAEQGWQDKLDQFIEERIESGKPLTLLTKSEFTIKGSNDQFIYASNKNNEKTETVQLNKSTILTILNEGVELKKVCDIKKYFRQKNTTQGNSYEFIVIQEVRKMARTPKSSTEVKAIDRKDFVFIIDEINRGEASKIFGELFYAIDPGYRGEEDKRVQTQYQNLVSEDDVFASGFYVPENVYILATMNDIDRSVESMDFAMRRRFTWKEVTPDDTAEMLDNLDDSCAEEAKKRMKSLNLEIAATDGLGEAYMIGPSYFLKLTDHQGDFEKLWSLNIEPLLREYLRGFRKTEETMKRFKGAFDSPQNVQESTSVEEMQ
jgi:hypothetical protein